MEASQQQMVTSLVTGSSMIQLKWLAPEQSVVKAGEPVAVFEAGSMAQSLIILEDDLYRLNMMRKCHLFGKFRITVAIMVACA